MRDLMQYPITKQEILDYLLSLHRDAVRRLCLADSSGDMEALLLLKVVQIIERTEISPAQIAQL